MRRCLLVICLLMGAAGVPSPAAAIANGTADSQRHRNVGGLVSPTQYPDGTGCTSSGRRIAAITITGDMVCRATNVTYRLATAPARTFVAQYVALR